MLLYEDMVDEGHIHILELDSDVESLMIFSLLPPFSLFPPFSFVPLLSLLSTLGDVEKGEVTVGLIRSEFGDVSVFWSVELRYSWTVSGSLLARSGSS